MNKKELIDAIAEQVPVCTLTQIADVLDHCAGAVQRALANGYEATLPGLGKLKPATRAQRAGRNPKTGETILIPARKAVKFSASKELREAVA